MGLFQCTDETGTIARQSNVLRVHNISTHCVQSPGTSFVICISFGLLALGHSCQKPHHSRLQPHHVGEAGANIPERITCTALANRFKSTAMSASVRTVLV